MLSVRQRAALGDAHPGTRVTSIAVACYPSHALDAAELLERALEALEYLRDNLPGGTEVARTD